ncbi:mitochondrial peripheral inner membrane protein [Ophidiomyces ophidiicola]|nr:mitochondrial peripheral inner membrane protein [Ophidiomyces ophidiicola]KAI1992245.1 mitochondrial peripheral inner membrane protein [Ophidiomyces ophidiicola]KAI1993252.1 mitochondrial peripheral inner membrane protein [Ophidiomyces ophidiicola]KAI1998593.1 mitochondrial peripheral inner membrane protein [Ophidiomyces ophidiicola]
MVPRLPPFRGFGPAIRGSAAKKLLTYKPISLRLKATIAKTNVPLAPKKNRWLRVTIVAIIAGGIGLHIRNREINTTSTLNPVTFTKFKLLSKEPISSTCSVFTLRPVEQGPNYEVYQEAWKRGLWSVQFKQPQLQVGRDYTPLPPIREDELSIDDAVRDGDNLQFLIRREPEGEVSGYLHSLKPGAILEFRGPQMEYELPDSIREVVFIAGGTGIAPALQAAYAIFGDRAKRDVRMHILWANRRREDCRGGKGNSATGTPKRRWSLFLGNSGQKQTTELTEEPHGFTVAQLEELKAQSRGQLSVDYFVDEENTLINEALLSKTIQKADNQPDHDSTRKLVLVSGPDGFVNYLAGPKLWRAGTEVQGPLQGLLKQLDLQGWVIWKL